MKNRVSRHRMKTAAEGTCLFREVQAASLIKQWWNGDLEKSRHEVRRARGSVMGRREANAKSLRYDHVQGHVERN